jgi:Ca2+:H+ antiporter
MPQFIVSVILLKKKSTSQIRILKASLIGSIVSNLHLLLGLGFIFGGINRYEQHFNKATAETSGMFLLLSITGMTVPTMSSVTSKVAN